MTKKHYSIMGFMIALSAFVGWEVRPVDVARFAQDELTIIQKNLDKSCVYAIHENTLLALCPNKSLINQ
ncbi:hypothetical protein DLL80_23845 [Salmonella enterica subsp. enterica serovar Newport]|uniref:Uncharacterized protein n=1 Tax=Salmonella newport TaxID=108619 RepID=A0A5V6RMI2_SALNE|nr:hypothetical protein [Salmonella enterica subsp. enterica serovar Newport]